MLNHLVEECVSLDISNEMKEEVVALDNKELNEIDNVEVDALGFILGNAGQEGIRIAVASEEAVNELEYKIERFKQTLKEKTEMIKDLMIKNQGMVKKREKETQEIKARTRIKTTKTKAIES